MQNQAKQSCSSQLIEGTHPESCFLPGFLFSLLHAGPQRCHALLCRLACAWLGTVGSYPARKLLLITHVLADRLDGMHPGPFSSAVQRSSACLSLAIANSSLPRLTALGHARISHQRCGACRSCLAGAIDMACHCTFARPQRPLGALGSGVSEHTCSLHPLLIVNRDAVAIRTCGGDAEPGSMMNDQPAHVGNLPRNPPRESPRLSS